MIFQLNIPLRMEIFKKYANFLLQMKVPNQPHQQQPQVPYPLQLALSLGILIQEEIMVSKQQQLL